MNKPNQYEIELLQEFAVNLIAHSGGMFLPEIAAGVLGITVGTLRRWHKLGKGPTSRVKFGQVFYDSKETWDYYHNGNYPRKMPAQPD